MSVTNSGHGIILSLFSSLPSYMELIGSSLTMKKLVTTDMTMKTLASHVVYINNICGNSSVHMVRSFYIIL